MLIGLTGGIGSGKTTVSDLFAELGIKIIDTDVISQNLTAAGGRAISLILENFGPKSIALDGSMDRKFMREKVFNSSDERKKLESILHPLIREEVKRQIQNLDGPYSILAVPLMNKDSSWIRLCDRILLVDCPEEEQIRRVKHRSGLEPAEIKKIIDSQSSVRDKLSFADDVLFNYSERDYLKKEILHLHQIYLKLSGLCPKSA